MGNPVDYSEKIDLFEATSTIDIQKNLIPRAASLSYSAAPMNIHRGSSQAQDQALAIGVQPEEVSMAYAPLSLKPYLNDRTYLRDENGDVYVIAGKPSVRGRFSATTHIRMLLQFCHIKPAGLS